MAKVTMPQLGESLAEGTIGRWLKKPGDRVAKYEPLLEVITDKVNAEVPSPFEGVLTEILVEEGATVPNNAEIAVIETSGDEGAASTAPVEVAQPAAPAEPAAPPERPAPAPAASAAAAVSAAAVSVAAPGRADARMTPAVRRLLREHGLEAAQIAGTGGGGRITRGDVLAHVEAVRTGQAPATPPPTAAAAPVAGGHQRDRRVEDWNSGIAG